MAGELSRGSSWQERWETSPASACPRRWTQEGRSWVTEVRWATVQAGLLLLACGDVVRLPLAWLVGHQSTHLRDYAEEVRDPVGFAQLKAYVDPGRWTALGGMKARLALARIILAKGGGLADITVGDAIEYDTVLREARAAVVTEAACSTPGCGSWGTCWRTLPRPCGTSAGSPASSPASSWWTGTAWPARRSGGC
ncbi:hypothetical protein ACIQPP_50470 [Streptomyces violaceusniger]|uniref:hypothetical protein n=1 Tax=Streptomyces violaceusniger TaxID=68280 RepID=UPI000996A96A|nr:hypothetical protein [Streptomyces hygroscopicus]